MNGYNFIEEVRAVLSDNRQRSAELHHEYFGTEHFLLAMLRDDNSEGAKVLRSLEVKLDEIEVAAQVLTAAGVTLVRAQAEVRRIDNNTSL